MKIAFVIFNEMTAIDLVGVYDPLTRLKTMGFISDISWDICAFKPTVRDSAGLGLVPDKVGGSLAGYDIVVIPGGYGTRRLSNDAAFLAWLATAADCPLKVSVCTGSLLWGAAGFLEGLPATTHRRAYETLQPFCAEVRSERIVDAGKVITAGGVTSGIDLGLYLCAKLAGPAARDSIARQMEYQC